ncbi:MAG: KilA-N domain-containing protein [Anaerovoracaceae bacterium]
MTKEYKDKIIIDEIEIAIHSIGDENDYISLTDIAKKRTDEYPGYVIQNWLRSRNTVTFLGIWEKIHNPNFNCLDFDAIKEDSGNNSFVLTPKKWISQTNAIGIITKQGRYAATFAHKDIAFKFASWISPKFELYIIKDYQRLKEDENSRLSLSWNLRRELSKTNYKVHTDAVKEHLVPESISAKQKAITYAEEADVLNVALFGMTAKEWKAANPNRRKNENIRDFASIEQLIILTNLESYNAELIKDKIPQAKRLEKLNSAAITQAKSLLENPSLKKIK